MARRSYDTLEFCILCEDKDGDSWEILITDPGSYPLPDGRTVTVRITSTPPLPELSATSRAWFDPSAAPFPWTLRTFRPGDRFRPFGMKGTKKLKDFFIERRVPLQERRRIPLLFSAEELLWVCGLRVAEAGRVLPGIREVVEVEIPEITP
jgi:tRNA(Ile)-lysidine synthase